MYVEVPIAAAEARYLSVAAVRMGMDLPNYLYWVAVDYANSENRRLALASNIKVPQLAHKYR